MADPDTSSRPPAPASDAPAADEKLDDSKDGRKAGLGSSLYKLALAGVGAVVLAQEELESAWKKTRDKAEADRTRGDGKADKTPPARPAEEKDGDSRGGYAAYIDGAISRVLRSLSIPTRDEVEQLSQRIEALSKAIDERAARR